MPPKARPQHSARPSRAKGTSVGNDGSARSAKPTANVKPNSNSVSPKKPVKASKTAKTARPQKKRSRKKSDNEDDVDDEIASALSASEDEEEPTPAKKKIKFAKTKVRSSQ